MINEKTGWTKVELRAEILSRMSALDVSGEEFSNEEVLSEYVNEIKRETAKKDTKYLDTSYNDPKSLLSKKTLEGALVSCFSKRKIKVDRLTVENNATKYTIIVQRK